MNKKLEPWQERFVLEYNQLSERVAKLYAMIMKYEQNDLDFTPNCSLELLKRQFWAMMDYKRVLEERSEIEGIELPNKVIAPFHRG